MHKIVETLIYLGKLRQKIENNDAPTLFHGCLLDELNKYIAEPRLIADQKFSTHSHVVLHSGEAVTHSPHSVSVFFQLVAGLSIPHLLVDISATMLLGFFLQRVWEGVHHASRMNTLGDNNKAINSLLSVVDGPSFQKTTKTFFVYEIANTLTHRLQHEIRHIESKEIPKIARLLTTLVIEEYKAYAAIISKRTPVSVTFDELISRLIDGIAPPLGNESHAITRLSEFYQQKREKSVLKNAKSRSREDFLVNVNNCVQESRYSDALSLLSNSYFYSMVRFNKHLREDFSILMGDFAIGGKVENRFKYGVFGRLIDFARSKKKNKYIHFDEVLTAIYTLCQRLNVRSEVGESADPLTIEAIRQYNLHKWVVTKDLLNIVSRSINEVVEKVEHMDIRIAALERVLSQSGTYTPQSDLYQSLPGTSGSLIPNLGSSSFMDEAAIFNRKPRNSF